MLIVQIVKTLGNGGTLVIVQQNSRGDWLAISELMLRENITVALATPSEYPSSSCLKMIAILIV